MKNPGNLTAIQSQYLSNSPEKAPWNAPIRDRNEDFGRSQASTRTGGRIAEPCADPGLKGSFGRAVEARARPVRMREVMTLKKRIGAPGVFVDKLFDGLYLLYSCQAVRIH